MKESTFRRELTNLTPDVPEAFHRRVEDFLREKTDQEVCMKGSTKRVLRRGGRFGRRTLVLALAIALILGTAAFAANRWGIFDTLSVYLGSQPPSADSVMQNVLHTETVNGVEITVREAGYDGRTLFLQYSYRFPDITAPLGREGAHGERLLDDAALSLPARYGVGWWVDAFWINGQPMEMASNSGGEDRGSAIPGELVHTEYWRLDNAQIPLAGSVEIALPIGETQSAEYRSSLFDRESGQYRLPDRGVVTFTLDAGDTLRRVVTLNPGLETVTPDVTAKVTEAAFTPLMTYIILELIPKAQGKGLDDYADWLAGLRLVDGGGKELFPDAPGCNGMSDTWAEYLFPFMDPTSLPEELWLAVPAGDAADMTYAIRVK